MPVTGIREVFSSALLRLFVVFLSVSERISAQFFEKDHDGFLQQTLKSIIL
jgi:hypothetical protein